MSHAVKSVDRGRRLWNKAKTLLLRRSRRISADEQPMLLAPSCTDSPLSLYPSRSETPSRRHSYISFEKPPRQPVDPEHNPNRPVNRLPPELLAHIFVLLSEECLVYDTSWVSACSHVCASWRQIALNTPTLWTKVVLTSQAWTDCCLERSKSALLKVEADLTGWTPAILGALPRICRLLELSSERIVRIDLSFYCTINTADPLIKLLSGPFPALESLSVRDRHDDWLWGVVDTHFIFTGPCVDPYPMLRELSVGKGSRLLLSLPPLIHLVSLHLDEVSWNDTWDCIANALDPMVNLDELSIGFLAPYMADDYPRKVCLPNLRRLELNTEDPANATKLLRALVLPKLREIIIELDTATETKALLESIFSLVGPPLSMRLESVYGTDCFVKGSLPAHSPLPGYFQHAKLSFSPAHIKDLWASSKYCYDVCISWETLSLPDTEMGSILAAISEIPAIAGILWLVLVNWHMNTEGFWRDFAQRIPRIETLAIVGAPPSGLFWAMLHDITLLPALAALRLNGINFGTGGWLAPLIGPPAPTISYFERDNSRFIEVLICYLEARPRNPARDHLRVEIINCSCYSVPEVKLLRMLVKELFWDGMGSVVAAYGMHWDESGGATIYHNLLTGQQGYEEINAAYEYELAQKRKEFWRRPPGLLNVA
ncbi:hypothetical protein C8F01DRAFT_1372931 [Mycena amicta]|nr:hypothetical protein C8F01DRAFT_1372931 [Mycena amicta]